LASIQPVAAAVNDAKAAFKLDLLAHDVDAAPLESADRAVQTVVAQSFGVEPGKVSGVSHALQNTLPLVKRASRMRGVPFVEPFPPRSPRNSGGGALRVHLPAFARRATKSAMDCAGISRRLPILILASSPALMRSYSVWRATPPMRWRASSMG